MTFALVRLHLFDRRLNHLPFSKRMLVVELNNKWIVVTRTFLGGDPQKVVLQTSKKNMGKLRIVSVKRCKI